MGPSLTLSLMPRNIPLRLRTPRNRDVSVSYCYDNAIKQATPKFTGYKSKPLYFLFKCPPAGPRSGSRLLQTQNYSFLHILLKHQMLAVCSSRGRWQVREMPNPTAQACWKLLLISHHDCSHSVDQINWDDQAQHQWGRKLNSSPRGRAKWLKICWIYPVHFKGLD